jgi:2-C-methyl-D-erythritol 4-phosphate cytidylyltransferase
VLVHDAARPCVPVDALRRLVAELAAEEVGGLLAIPVADTLKRATPVGDGGPRVLRTVDRKRLWQAQTPQMFRAGVLRAALAAPGALEATDEAAAVEALAATGACAPPRLVVGSALNLKVTYPADLTLAAAILRAQESGE